MAAIVKDIYFNTGRWFGSKDPGFAADNRFGVIPNQLTHDGTYAWPALSGPAPITLTPAFHDTDWGDTSLPGSITDFDRSPYGRERLDHFSIVGGNWNEYTRLHSHDYTFESTSPNGQIQSVSSYGPNTGFGVHINPYVAQGQGSLIMSMEFGHTDPEKKLRLNVWDDGKGFFAIGSGDTPEKQLGTGYLLPARNGSVGGLGFTKVSVVPQSRNRVNIYSNRGPGFSATVPNLSKVPLLETYKIHPADGTLYTQFPPSRSAPITQRGPLSLTVGPKVLIQPGPLRYKGAVTYAGLGGVGGSVKLPANMMGIGSPQAIPHIADVPYKLHVISIHDLKYPASGDGVYIETPTVAYHDNTPYISTKIHLVRPNGTVEDLYHSPQVYRLEHEYPSVLGTDEGIPETNLSKDLISFTHNHQQGGLTGDLTFRFAEKYSTYRRLFNIPFQYKEAGNVYVEGVVESPNFSVHSPYDQELKFGFTDETKWLKNTMFAELSRFDGLSLDDAVKAILIAAGFPEDGSRWIIDETEASADGRKGNKVSKGEGDEKPTNASDAIKSCHDWLSYLVETYTSAGKYPYIWVYGFEHYPDTASTNPDPPEITKFYLKNPDNFSDTPTATFYGRQSEAIALGSFSHSQAYTRVHEQWSETIIEPECNYLVVSGWQTTNTPGDEANEDGGEPITKVKFDKDGMNPSLPVVDRKANWLGERRHVLIIDSALNTDALVSGAITKIWPRLSSAKARATFTAEWLPSLRLWDMLRIYHPTGTSADETGVIAGPEGNVAYNDWRLVEYSVEHIQDTRDDGTRVWIHRPAKYTVERVLA